MKRPRALRLLDAGHVLCNGAKLMVLTLGDLDLLKQLRGAVYETGRNVLVVGSDQHNLKGELPSLCTRHVVRCLCSPG